MIDVFRFMSDTEKHLLSFGVPLLNLTDHGAVRGRDVTTSKGFCFGIGGVDEAVARSKYLKGIVIMDWLLVAEADEGMFTKSQAWYISQFDNEGNPVSRAVSDEFCCDQYGEDSFYKMIFYPVRGIRSIKGLKVDAGTAIIGAGVVRNKEKRILQGANRIARLEMIDLSERASKDTLNFTRIPRPKPLWN